MFLIRDYLFAKKKTSKKSCTSMVDNMVSKLLSRSNTFKELYEALRTVPVVGYITDQEISSTMNQSGLTRIHLPGIIVSWSPSGTYKPSCLLDYCRFHLLRPPKAEAAEQRCWWTINVTNEAKKVIGEKMVTNKVIWDTDSCAEWAAFLELASASTDTMSVTEPTQW
jgi:hypothetical protein